MSNIQLVNNLYRLRKAHHLTQQELSDKLSISRQAYSNYETSKRTPDLDSLIRLSQLYHVTLDQLINQNCLADGTILTIREGKAPYYPALEIESSDTLYLTRKEVGIIEKYRLLSADDKRIIEKFLD